MKKILMVCTANICRSPMAKLVLQKLVANVGQSSHWQIDSAGTHAPLSGERADPRADAALQRRGYQTPKHKSRGVQPQDFETFDLLLAMDSDNLTSLLRRCPAQHQHKLHLLMEYAPQAGVRDVPDPYYGNAQGFERVLDLCESATQGLFKQLSG
jgi:protein-tyrosine phosphatase